MLRLATLLTLLILLGGVPADAAQSCAMAKLAAVAEVGAAKLACHADAAAAGSVVNPSCLGAADATLTDELVAAEASGGCDLTADATTVGAEIDSFVAGVVAVERPMVAANLCSSAQLDATARAARQRIQCQRRGERRGTDIDQRCGDKSNEDLMGGFATAQQTGTCSGGADVPTITLLLDEWTEQIASWLRPVRRVSVSSRGAPARRPSIEDRISSVKGAISADGRFVAFNSNAEDLVRGDANGNDIFDILVHDMVLGTTELANVSSSGAQANADPPGYVVISADGRYVAFDSHAITLVPNDTNLLADVFVRDRLLGTTERVSVDSSGTEASGGLSVGPTVSADGRFVAFTSAATNLVANDMNAHADIFVRDRQAGTTDRISLGMNGTEADGDSTNPVLASDGSAIAFWSSAANLVPGDTPFSDDVFLVDRTSDATELISVTWDGSGSNAPYGSGPFPRPSLSGDARFVAFNHLASNIVQGDSNGVNDIFVRDRMLGTTQRISVGLNGTEANGQSIFASISADGRFVAFESVASNLVADDTNGVADVFIADRNTGIITRASVAVDGSQGNDFSSQPGLSDDGRHLVFWSKASNLVRRDRNGRYLGFDVFVRSLP